MSSYNKLSKEFYIKMFTEYLAYEIYLDQSFHKKHNNTIKQIYNSCFDNWNLSNKEEKMIRDALILSKDRYNVSL